MNKKFANIKHYDALTSTMSLFSGGQFAPEKGGQFTPEWGGQFVSDSGGQFGRFFHVLPKSLKKTGCG